MTRRLGVWMVVVVLVSGCDRGAPEGPGEAPPPVADTAAVREADAVVEEPLATGSGCYSYEACAAACEADAPEACQRQARFLFEGWGREPDPEAARRLLQRACDEAEDLHACASLYGVTPEGAARDALGARLSTLAEARCEAGEGFGCVVRMIFEEDPEARAELSRAACVGGHVATCERLFVMSFLDPALIQELDVDLSALLGRACDDGEPAACRTIALLPEDPAMRRARTLFEARCEAGWPPACQTLGGFYRDDLELLEEARAAFDRACELGLDDACDALIEPDPRFSGRFRVTSWTQTPEGGCDAPAEPWEEAPTHIQLVRGGDDNPLLLGSLLLQLCDADGACEAPPVDRSFRWEEERRSGWEPAVERSAFSASGAETCDAAQTRSTIELGKTGVKIRRIRSVGLGWPKARCEALLDEGSGDDAANALRCERRQFIEAERAE